MPHKTIYIFILLGISTCLKAQFYLHSSMVQGIQLRPNIGLEYRFKHHGLRVQYTFQRNDWFQLYEFPTNVKVENGHKAELGYRYYLKSPFYVETSYSFMSYNAPPMLQGQRGSYLFNDQKENNFGLSAGALFRQKKKWQFSAQLGYYLGNHYKAVEIDRSQQYDENNQFFTIEELLTTYRSEAYQREFINGVNIDFHLYFRLKN